MSKKKHRKRRHFSKIQPIPSTDTWEKSSQDQAPFGESVSSTPTVECKDRPSAPELRPPPGTIPLFGPLDKKTNIYPFLWFIPFREARERLRAGQVEKLESSRKHIRSVHLVEKAPPAEPPVPAIPDPEKPASLRRKSMGDSHNRERDDNPAGVWTIDSIPDTKAAVFVGMVFDGVLFDLLFGPGFRRSILKRAA